MKIYSLLRRQQQSRPNRGFALVVTLSLMILLTVIAVGLLSLSSISLRSTGAMAASNIARANARMALMLALGELQKAAGSDKRVTADSSILAANGAQVTNPNVVGVWKGWSPTLAVAPNVSGPNYTTQKNSQFVSWLTSSTDFSTEGGMISRTWAQAGSLATPFNLYTVKSDGFDLPGSIIDLRKGKSGAGAFAWTMIQDATRAKINVGGPENSSRILNNDLQAQARPYVVDSTNFIQPTKDWDLRAGRVISVAQAKLDPDLGKSDADTAAENGDYTAQGFGLLTDVVKGGLKTDLNLAFELSDSEFKNPTWGDYKNPFSNLNATVKAGPYQKEQPIFRPYNPTQGGSTKVTITYTPATTSFDFPASGVPTFTLLRSFYRTPYHMYNTPDGPTIFERGMDNASFTPPAKAPLLTTASGSPTSMAPGLTPPGVASQTGYRPILDRVLFILSIGVNGNTNPPDKQVRLIMTPVITLWNPYNVALEIEGAVAYPWLDLPYGTSWTFGKGTATTTVMKDSRKEDINGEGMANLLGYYYLNLGHGRSNYPYFYASITPNGTDTITKGQSIRFEPGEVRVFCPATAVEKDYLSKESIRNRTLNMRPVSGKDDYNLKGGFAIKTDNLGISGYHKGIVHVLDDSPNGSETASLILSASGDNYPIAFALEDSTRAQKANPSEGDRGQITCDVETFNFAKSSVATQVKSASFSYAVLAQQKRTPFAVVETYHRTANDSSSGRKSDIVYTVNPRQSFVNQYIAPVPPGPGANISAGPHYETRMTSITTTDGAIQTKEGRKAYYGGTGLPPGGVTNLAFFEAPQAPLLSLAAFQHADIATTCYSSGNQIGNSWASAYIVKSKAAASSNPANPNTSVANFNRGSPMPVYDYSYLANEALWDTYFFSGAAPTMTPASSGNYRAWDSDIVSPSKSLNDTLSDFIDGKKPLLNPRMKFYAGGDSPKNLKIDLLKSEGCLKIASKLMVDGAFNINSTSKKAWVAFLSGNRDIQFNVDNGKGSAPASGSGKTAFPRFRSPVGKENDPWFGYRSLTESQINLLADQIIDQVKKRGPFLSLAEFVNRRVDTSAYATKGALQAAIDAVPGINQSANYLDLTLPAYGNGDFAAAGNISPAKTGVGTPGYLTQADVLQSLSPTMTPRSDTFTIRAYGEAHDAGGNKIASAWCEAVVQRMPEFIDPANPPEALTSDLNEINGTFGRRFNIQSFRYLAEGEIPKA